MLQALKKDMQLNWKDIFALPAFIGGGFLFGQLLMAIIFAIDGPDEWFPMSTLMAAILGVVCLFILDGVGFTQRYSLALTMSQSRRPLLAAAILTAVIHTFLCMALLLAAAGLDLLIGRLFYIGVDEAPAELLLFLLRMPWPMLLAVIPIVCMTLFSAALQGRIGRKAGTILYVFFLCSCNLIGPVMDFVQSRPDGIIARFFAWCGSLHPAVWIVLAVLVMAAMLVSALRMLYKMRAEIC